MSPGEVVAIAAVGFGCLLMGVAFGDYIGHRRGYREGRRYVHRFAVHRSRITATDPLDQVPQHTHN
jgi:hypothetical protein